MDWLQTEVSRYEKRVRRREAWRNGAMWFWPAVAVCLVGWLYFKGLF